MKYLKGQIDECVVQRYTVQFPIDDELLELCEREGLDLEDLADQPTILTYALIEGLDHHRGESIPVKTKESDVYSVDGLVEGI